MLAVSALVLVLVYVLAVLTPAGQAFENAALRGADQQNATEFAAANEALGAITVWSLGAATLAVGLIGVLRKQLFLAAVAVGVIVAGQLVTQTLKRFVLPRPELVQVTGDFTGNSFPSGHTTIAMTVLIAVFLVVPYRARGIVMFFVAGWAVGIGAYTLSAKWHRLSDTIGADLVALIVGAVAAIVLLKRGSLRRVSRGLKLRAVGVALAAVMAAGALAIGLLLASVVLRFSLEGQVIEWDVYLAVHALALAGSLIAAIVYWITWRRIEVVGRAE